MSNRRSAALRLQASIMRHVLDDHASHQALDDSAAHISACLAPVSSSAPMLQVRIISENPSGPVATQSSAVPTAFAALTSVGVWLLTQIVVLPARLSPITHFDGAVSRAIDGPGALLGAERHELPASASRVL